MVKRIARYIGKSAQAKDILNMSWLKGIKKFLQGAMASYCASCQERRWFYDLNLGQTLGRAAWVILTACKAATPPYEEVCQLALEEWYSWLGETLRNKAIWIAAEEVC